MTIDELTSAIQQVIDGGRLGTPVALRIHLHLVDEAEVPANSIGQLWPLVNRAIDDAPETLCARTDASRRQTSLIVQHAGGQTTMMTVTTGVTDRTRIALFVVGNHGATRLEGDQFEWSSNANGDASIDWAAWIDSSQTAGSAVRCPA